MIAGVSSLNLYPPIYSFASVIYDTFFEFLFSDLHLLTTVSHSRCDGYNGNACGDLQSDVLSSKSFIP